jgi:hypothetical protein
MKRWERAKALLGDDIITHPNYMARQRELFFLHAKKWIYRCVQAAVFILGASATITLVVVVSKYISSHQLLNGLIMIPACIMTIFSMVKLILYLDNRVEDIKEAAISLRSWLNYNRLMDAQKHHYQF